jgi:hypothetical protein
MLPAEQIRNTTRNLLVSVTDAGTNVFSSPILPLRRERPLPCLSVYTQRDHMVPLNGDSGCFQFRHHLDVTIEAVAETFSDITQTAGDRLQLDACTPADSLIEQVRAALYPNPLWYTALELSSIGGDDVRYEFGSILDTDRRTVAAILTVTVIFDEYFPPVVTDEFHIAYITVDCIEPFNPNLAAIGPDGQVEVTLQVPKSGTLWTLPVSRRAALQLSRLPGARQITSVPRTVQ